METVKEVEIIEEQLIKAKKMLDESREKLQQMQDIVFCMEIEAKELKEKLESEIH